MKRMTLMLLAACGSCRSGLAASERTPTIEVAPVADLCVTKGAIERQAIAAPTVRAVAPTARGDAAELAFTFAGDAATNRALANGQLRRQVGLKLRAADGCNLVYIMWRLDPRPKLEVSVKSNPGKRTHEQCGADGYIKVKPTHAVHVPALEAGTAYRLRAEIVGDELTAWIDGRVAWHGELPAEARALVGPAGLRSDNVALEHVALAVQHGPVEACRRGRDEPEDD
jgi:hypothetical protein